MQEASRYFDVANFAPDIKFPVLVGLGLIDETCPPEGFFTAVNQSTSLTELIFLPKSGRQKYNGVQRAYEDRRDNVWRPAPIKGQTVLVAH